MRLTQILYGSQKSPALVVWSEKAGGWLDVAALTNRASQTTLASVLRGESDLSLNAIREALSAYEASNSSSLAVISLDASDVRFQPLLDSSSKILCVGLNYADHAKEFGDDLPSEPVIFCKASSALSCAGADIVLPSSSRRVDYEGELVVVVGKRCKDVAESEALNYVAGYACGNDVSARDWQKGKPAGQWFLGKSFDTFAPIGPWMVTADEVGNPNALKIESRLNGKTMQSSSTTRFIFKVERLLSYLSQVMTLEPGDLIFTGTPDGVGDVRQPAVYLEDADEFCVEIEKLGVLRNSVRRPA